MLLPYDGIVMTKLQTKIFLSISGRYEGAGGFGWVGLGADVRNSVRILKAAGAYQSGKDTVILEDPGGTRVVYKNEDGCLYRISTTAGVEKRIPMGRLKSVGFSYAPGGPESS